jgi:hypothetical protein
MRALSPQARAALVSRAAPLRVVALVASLAALGLGTATGLAAGNPNAPVRGVVIGVSSESMEIQNASGPVTVAITDDTRVIRTVSGTVADLRRGQVVELTLDARSGRVTQVHIAPPGTKLAESKPGQGRGRGRAKKRGPSQIRAVTRRTIRVRYGNGQFVTYRFVSKPRVIKDVPGRIGDILIGQTVLVTRSHGGRVATLIVIVNG